MTHTAPPAWADTYTIAALKALPADLRNASPAQVDEVIRTMQLEAQRATATMIHMGDVLHLALGHTKHSERSGHARRSTVTEWWVDEDGATVESGTVEATARALPADTQAKRGWHRAGTRTLGDLLGTLDMVRGQHAEAMDTIRAMNAEYQVRGGWTRYYWVDNSNGHVHKSTDCDTCYATTVFVWPTALSGATSEDVVEAAGSLTCLRCFPEVRGTILEQRPPQREMFETPEMRDARRATEQEKAAKREAKIAKGVTPDGSPLVTQNRVPTFGRVEVKTERAAELRYVEFSADAVRCDRIATGGRPEVRETFRDEAIAFRAVAAELLAALAAKRGQTVDEARDALAPKVEKKIARETY